MEHNKTFNKNVERIVKNSNDRKDDNLSVK